MHPARVLDRVGRVFAKRRVGVLRLVLVAAGVLLVAGGCALTGPGEAPVDEVWRVVDLDGQPVPRLPDNRAPTLLLESKDVRASGFTGCNRMTGSYRLAGAVLDFGLMATTRMACEATGAGVEMQYLAAIETITRWRRRDGALELLDAQDHVRMRLQPSGRVDTLLPK